MNKLSKQNIKVLIVYSGNKGFLSPFVNEQIEALKSLHVEFDYFSITKKGIIGYIKHYFLLNRKIKIVKPDIIHAHYGLSGLIAALRFGEKVITTFHGSDITKPFNRYISYFAYILSTKAIFVSKNLSDYFKIKNPIIIPCGVDTNLFKPIDIKLAAQELSLNMKISYILFSSSFTSVVKNYPLAKAAIDLIKQDGYNVQLIELKGYSRDEVVSLINIAKCCLLTSFTEGSPQFIKEALACNCPIVSTDVGDVKANIMDIEGCYITSYDTLDVANKLKMAINFSNSNFGTKGRDRILKLGLDNETISKNILSIYKSLISS